MSADSGRSTVPCCAWPGCTSAGTQLGVVRRARADEREARCPEHRNLVAEPARDLPSLDTMVLGHLTVAAQTPRDIAEELGLPSHDVGAALRRLEAQGLALEVRTAAGRGFAQRQARPRPQPQLVLPTPTTRPPAPPPPRPRAAQESPVQSHVLTDAERHRRAAERARPRLLALLGDHSTITTEQVRGAINVSGSDRASVFGLLLEDTIELVPAADGAPPKATSPRRYRLHPSRADRGLPTEIIEPPPSPMSGMALHVSNYEPRAETPAPTWPTWVYLAAPLAGETPEVEAWHQERVVLLARFLQQTHRDLRFVVPHTAVRPLYDDGAQVDGGPTRAHGLAHSMELLRLVHMSGGQLWVLLRDDGSPSPGCAAEVTAWERMGGEVQALGRWEDWPWPEAFAEAAAELRVPRVPQRHVLADALHEQVEQLVAIRLLLDDAGIPRALEGEDGSTTKVTAVERVRMLAARQPPPVPAPDPLGPDGDAMRLLREAGLVRLGFNGSLAEAVGAFKGVLDEARVTIERLTQAGLAHLAPPDSVPLDRDAAGALGCSAANALKRLDEERKRWAIVLRAADTVVGQYGVSA